MFIIIYTEFKLCRVWYVHMNNNNKELFQNKLQKSVNKKIFLLISIGCLLFSVGVYIMNYSVNQSNATKHLEALEGEFIDIYEYTTSYLKGENTNRLFLDVLNGEIALNNLMHSFYEFGVESEIKSNLILTNYQGDIVYTSFKEDDFNLHLKQFNQVVCDNAKFKAKNGIYNAIYYLSGSYSSYIFSYPVHEGDDVIGFANIYLSGNEWHYHLSDYNFNSVITDQMGNVIISSRKSLIQKINKFNPKIENNIYKQGENRYWIVTRSLSKYNVIIYSLVYYPQNASFFMIGLIVILLLGFSWFQLAKKMTFAMAEKNASSINELVREIKIIRKEDSEYRINMNTNDEFSDVGIQINRMLDNVKELNEKNTKLLELNNIIELKQLTAQFNPHFLYNTLETIRCLDFQDPSELDKLIARLTQILRYSIDNSCKDARLIEDMKYIEDYLEIQTVRYGERFKYTIYIDEACHHLIVPKLLLQPIIENSIKYGFLKRMEIEIHINIILNDGILCLYVEDNGYGMTLEQEMALKESLSQVENTTAHNGLHNIARRLYLSYGEGSRIELNNMYGEGLGITIFVVPNARR